MNELESLLKLLGISTGIAIFLSFIIPLIILICFFCLCYNVWKIKKEAEKIEEFKKEKQIISAELNLTNMLLRELIDLQKKSQP